MKTAVDKVSKGNGRIVNTRFFAMTAHYLFDPDFCNVASGWEKGVDWRAYPALVWSHCSAIVIPYLAAWPTRW
jgi:hypothetical protein